MKKLMNLWLMAALVCGLSLSVTSCKDDDDDNKSEEQQAEEQAEKATKFWSVVGQLVSSDDYDADYQDKTFDPTYGIADAANETTRIVETNDMQTAASRFAELVDASIDENTPTYTYSDPEVGTLTYTRGGTANEWATVDVNIKQVPRLRKIIYREGGEGTNASFSGKAYYRFGDVVSRTLDNGQVEYWICVRPAFSPEKKGDSHWVCMNYLPIKNVFSYDYQGHIWYVPTGIGKDKEDMQNLAEMLYAMCDPKEWYENANNLHTDGKLWGFSGLPIFADFSKANVMYHNQYFWQKVADAWERHEIANKAMDIDLEVLFDQIDKGKGIHLLYEGYSWWTKTSWNCTLHEASYTNGQKNEEKNLHHAEYKDITKRMQDVKFDCREMGSNTGNYIQFFDNDGKYRWVVRHATGADLNGGSEPSPTAPLQGPGIKTVYRYYDEYEAEWLRKGPNGQSGHPEVTEAPTEQQQTEEQAEKATKFWRVVGQLVSSDDYDADYQDKTFKPTYGIADATNETTRIVETNDMQTAARRFADLVGASIDENTPSYTYSDPEVGMLTYTRSGTADKWATVDVSIKRMPRLRKIVYRQGGEGTNASFTGKAYYRFGDVVSRTLDNGQVEYWICVRPAFSPEKKSDSHWVCMNYLPIKNVFSYDYQGHIWYVPAGIGTDKENMQNLAEMLYAITRPDQWYTNANNYHTDGNLWGFSGLPIFADFSKANLMYHNQYFWQKVADAWKRREVPNNAMNIDFKVLADYIYTDAIHLLYEGYSWWTKTSWNCTLHEAIYKNGLKNAEENKHHAEYKDITKWMQDVKFDCREMGSNTGNYIQFFDNDGKYRWVVRHATGADLNGGTQPAPTAPLQGKGVKQFYRYYDEYEAEWVKKGPNGESGHPEVTEAQ